MYSLFIIKLLCISSVSYQSYFIERDKEVGKNKFSINKDELSKLNFYYPSLALNSGQYLHIYLNMTQIQKITTKL